VISVQKDVNHKGLKEAWDLVYGFHIAQQKDECNA